MDRYLTTKQVAELLAVSHTTATRHMALAGALNLGCGGRRSYRITEAELRAYLDSKRAVEAEPMALPTAPKKRKGRTAHSQVDYSWALKRR